MTHEFVCEPIAADPPRIADAGDAQAVELPVRRGPRLRCAWRRWRPS